MKLSQKHKIKIVKFAKLYNVRVRFTSMPIGGEADCRKNTIIMSEIYECQRSLWSHVCHEIAHVLAYRDNKFYNYHHHLNTYEVRNHLSTAFRAEKYVDKLGSKIFKEHFPEMKYYWTYYGNNNKKWLISYLKGDDFRIF